jgi:MoxR-like ATPase
MIKFTNDVDAVKQLRQSHEKLSNEVKKVIIGQDEVVKEVLITIFSRGHCLLIGVPGLAKTLLVNTLAQSLGLKYNRIQFTPDLMPSDIIGTEVLDENRQFRFIKGPLFANFILADEINRTPPKTQSALLEAMQERTITAAGHQFELEKPFFVLATQNPIEQEGTYPLPEAQLDRFMFNTLLDYPKFNDEIEIVRATTSDISVSVENVLSAEDIIYYQELVRRVPVNDNVLKYAVNLSSLTRPGNEKAHEFAAKYINWGVGPRASQYLIVGAKAHAVLNGKYSPDIEDIQAIAHPVLRHRIIKNYKAEAEGITVDQIISELIKTNKV